MNFAQLFGIMILVTIFGGGLLLIMKELGVKRSLYILGFSITFAIAVMCGLSLAIFGDLHMVWYFLEGPPRPYWNQP